MIKRSYLNISVILPLVAAFFAVGVAFAKTTDDASIETKLQLSKKHNTFEYKISSKKINRVEALEKFFDKYNSPLSEHADTFVKVADKYGMDYKLMPSIACLESTCGKFLIPGTHNPFGWGAGRIKFDSYDEAIELVGKGLNDIYLSRGLDSAQKIAPVYNPPSPYTWTRGVNFFISKIEEISLDI